MGSHAGSSTGNSILIHAGQYAASAQHPTIPIRNAPAAAPHLNARGPSQQSTSHHSTSNSQ